MRLPACRIFLPDAPQIKDIGLCPYPPALAVLYAPIGAMPFGVAAVTMYFGSIGLALAAARAIATATGGRISGLAAAVAIFYYPGLYYALWLGQNSLITLALLAIVLAVPFVLAAPDAAPSPPSERALYAATLIQAAPGKLLELIELERGFRAAAAERGDASPWLLRHSQGDKWDLLRLQPMGSAAEYFSSDRLTTR